MNDRSRTLRDPRAPAEPPTRVVRRVEVVGDRALAEEHSCPYLTVLAGGSAGRVYELTEGEVLLGRDFRCAIVLDDDSISRRHAVIRVATDGRVEIEDLESTNGTMVNGVRVSRTQLGDGDRILLGSRQFMQFDFVDPVEARLHRKLYEAATRDGLTGVYNRRYFRSRMEEEISFAVRHGAHLGLALVDLDRFKEINDTWGHQAGDAFLQEVAGAMLDTVRSEDVVCRFGGDEMAVILRGVAPDTARGFAERLRERVENIRLDVTDGAGTRCDVGVTVSIGLAVFDPEVHADGDALVAVADQRLYEAKRKGRNRVVASL
jgi:two-component system cell cycle response regulator